MCTERRDYFYTMVLQMAAAASRDTLQPVFIPSQSSRTVPAAGAGINSYLDGVEGYIHPKTLPQPAGTVRLMRKCNLVRDDHAIFPETAFNAMAAQGYT